jgi:hypothetical protein
MLANTLNTNEIKNSAGTEVEFGRLSQGERTTEFGALTETPSSPHRLSVKHTEIGAGTDLRRRSAVRVDKTITGQVDTTKSATVSFYVVADIPIGNMTAYAEAQNVCAELVSFLASTGADTTIKYDCSGNGAVTLISGTL